MLGASGFASPPFLVAHTLNASLNSSWPKIAATSLPPMPRLRITGSIMAAPKLFSSAPLFADETLAHALYAVHAHPRPIDEANAHCDVAQIAWVAALFGARFSTLAVEERRQRRHAKPRRRLSPLASASLSWLRASATSCWWTKPSLSLRRDVAPDTLQAPRGSRPRVRVAPSRARALHTRI